MAPPRLLFFSKVTEAQGAGGMQRHLSWALRWFADTGADVTLVTTAGGALPPDSGARSIEISGTQPGRYSATWWSGTRRFIRERPLSDWDAIVSEDGGAWGVVEELRRDPRRPPIAMFRHGTTLATIRSSIPPRHPRAVGIALLSFRDYVRHPRRLARSVDLMIALSETIARSARTEGAGPETEVRVVRLGVDLQRFSPSRDVAADRRTLGLDPALPTLTWVGRDTTSKRAQLALRVMDSLSVRGFPCQMALAVAQPRPSTLALIDTLNRRHGARVHLFPDAEQDKVRVIHRASSCLLFPSYWAEGLPITIMEALASGSPVLAWPGPSFRDLDVFQERGDWVVPSSSVTTWADRTTALLQQAGEGRLATAARAIAERYYNIDDTARNSVAAVNQLIERWPRRDR
jgi:glycosyltransferase involved in cell wall biosynthesis